MSFFSLIFAGFQTVLLCPVVSIPWKTLTVQVLITSTFGKIIIKFREMSHIFLSLPPGLLKGAFKGAIKVAFKRFIVGGFMGAFKGSFVRAFKGAFEGSLVGAFKGALEGSPV